MKTFDIMTMIVFSIMAIICCIAGFFNHIHWLFSIFYAIMTWVAWLDYKREKRDENQDDDSDSDMR